MSGSAACKQLSRFSAPSCGPRLFGFSDALGILSRDRGGSAGPWAWQAAETQTSDRVQTHPRFFFLFWNHLLPLLQLRPKVGGGGLRFRPKDRGKVPCNWGPGIK